MASSAYDRRDFSHVRIWSQTETVGGGFVVGERLVMTCAHVVRASLGPNAESDETGRPTGEVFLDSLAAAVIPTRRDPNALLAARVVPGKWIPRDENGGGDIALLELCEGYEFPPAAMIVVRSEKPVGGRGFSTYGILAGSDEAGRRAFRPKIVEGKLQGPLGGGRYQVTSPLEETAVRKGCSGAAVWLENEAVVGMIVSWQEKLSGVMVPVDVLERVHPIPRDRAPAIEALAALVGDSSGGIAAILDEQLPTFDREPQTTRFEKAITRAWDKANRPLLCLVGGLPADLPRACRETLRTHLGGRFAALQVATARLKAHKLPWPDTRHFDVDDALEALKNGIKTALKETRGNDPDLLRDKYNAQLEGIVFFSDILQGEFGRDHQRLLREWKLFWEAFGSQPLNKPLAHLLLLTFREKSGFEARSALKSRQRFYESQFAAEEGEWFDRLPILTTFCADDVDVWLESFADDVALDAGVIRRLKLRAGSRFPAESSSRLVELEKWIQEIGEGKDAILGR